MRFLRLTKLVGFGISACLLLAISQPTSAATDEQIETAIDSGIAWLASAQRGDGSFGSRYRYTAETCLALIKLQDRAYELGFDSPFDDAYEYSENVVKGWQYVFGGGRTLKQTLSVQNAGDPDTTGNGYGVYFRYDYRHYNYTAGVCLMALASSGDPDRANHGGLDFDSDGNVDTYGELAQETVDWLAFSQTDFSTGRGGWFYGPCNNCGYLSDNSHTGYVVLGLAAAQNFGATVPQFVKNELGLRDPLNWIDYIQNDVTGGSGYTSPTYWQNVLKTGNLLFEMTFVGDDPSTSVRFENALQYIEAHWLDPGNCSSSSSSCQGWGYVAYPAKYQAMFALMKGLEYSNIQLIDTDDDGIRDDDWFNQEPSTSPMQDFASVLVAQQHTDGYWPYNCAWGNYVLCTTWALLTLEKITPVADPFDITVEKDYRYTSVCFERDDDMDGVFNEDPVDFDSLGAPIDNDHDGLFNEDAVDCYPSDTGYMLPVSGMDPEAFTVEAVLKKNGTVTSYNPGQYYAVSSVVVDRLSPTEDPFVLTITEDFESCTVGEKPISSLNPKKGGGSVVVVEVIDGVAYQVYDAKSDVITIDKIDGVETSATATFEYAFDEDQETAEFLVYVKFAPGLKGMTVPAYPDDMCMNTNSGLLEIFEEGETEPVFSVSETADAWLKVVPKY